MPKLSAQSGLVLLPTSVPVVQPHRDDEHDEDGTEDREHVIKTTSMTGCGEHIDGRHGRSLSRPLWKISRGHVHLTTRFEADFAGIENAGASPPDGGFGARGPRQGGPRRVQKGIPAR